MFAIKISNYFTSISLKAHNELESASPLPFIRVASNSAVVNSRSIAQYFLSATKSLTFTSPSELQSPTTDAVLVKIGSLPT